MTHVRTTTYKQYGFTLLELSIVLVIIALIAGGIMAARSLIHNAELQSVLADIDRFKKATLLFKDKYKEMPGDFSTATNLWGDDTLCPAVAANLVAKIATCNGNGDGFIVNATDMTPIGKSVVDNALYETMRVWQHLANAGFIEGQYSGAVASVSVRQSAGRNVPASKLNNATYDMFYAPRGAATGVFNANYRHIIVYGRPYSGGDISFSNINPALTTADASSLDEKIDDGKPGLGKVLTFTSALVITPNCATSTVESSAEYKIATTGLQCALIFMMGF